MRQVIIGAGEVGRALAAVLYDAELVDVDGHGGAAEVLHIAFPWSETFEEQVALYEATYEARLVIVHSTVPVGTCDPRGWVHSPVRGRHPQLEEGVRTFTKHVGGVRAREAANLLAGYGLDVADTPLAATTEAGKLWELIGFGMQVAIEKAVHEHCATLGLDYEVAYRQMAVTYNEGYQKLGEDRFVRPVLSHMPGPIGGHCVTQNAAMIDHPLADLVRRVV